MQLSYIIQDEMIYEVQGMSQQFDGYGISKGLPMKWCIWFEMIMK